MAHSQSDFLEWIDENEIPESIKECLIEKAYNSRPLLLYLTAETIDKFDLSHDDKMILKKVLDLRDDASNSSKFSMVLYKNIK